MRRRTMLMLGLAVACIAAASVVIGLSASGSDEGGTVDDPQAVATPSEPYVVFRNLDRSDAKDYGRVAVAALDDIAGTRTLAGVACDRVDFSGAKVMPQKLWSTDSIGSPSLVIGRSSRFSMTFRPVAMSTIIASVEKTPMSA